MLQATITSVCSLCKSGLIILVFLTSFSLLSKSQNAAVSTGQKVFVTNDKSSPVPVVVTNPTGNSNQTAVIPYRLNKNVGPLLSNAYDINDSKANYMWTIEYIALSSSQGVDHLLVEVWSGVPLLSFKITPGAGLTAFFTKIRIAPGERLRIKAVGTAGQMTNPVNVHVSGYYEPIPR
jgi:hypothetical protein